MKIKWIVVSLAAVLSFQVSSPAQNNELSRLLTETESVAEKTAYQADIEYTFDVKQIREKDGKKSSVLYESVCSKKRCVYILAAKNDVPLSEKEITKNREKAAAKLLKAESAAESNRSSSLNLAGMTIFNTPLPDAFYRKSAYFNPNVYLKNCKINFVEKASYVNRAAIKLSATECGDAVKLGMSGMPKTAASIWIDEQEKAVVKLEIYVPGKELGNASSADKPFMIMEAARIPQGFWFWKSMTANTDALGLFAKDFKLSSECFNYKLSSVTVDKVEIDKK